MAGKSWTWGVGVTAWEVDGDNAAATLTYNSADVKVRYYPRRNPPAGFSLGGSVGFTRVRDEDPSTVPPLDEVVSGSSFGMLIEYQWLLGPKKKFAIALGLGAKGLSIDENEVTSTAFVARYPTARMSVGWAF